MLDLTNNLEWLGMMLMYALAIVFALYVRKYGTANLRKQCYRLLANPLGARLLGLVLVGVAAIIAFELVYPIVRGVLHHENSITYAEAGVGISVIISFVGVTLLIFGPAVMRFVGTSETRDPAQQQRMQVVIGIATAVITAAAVVLFQRWLESHGYRRAF